MTTKQLQERFCKKIIIKLKQEIITVEASIRQRVIKEVDEYNNKKT